MSDRDTRNLEREVATNPEDRDLIERLKRDWARSATYRKCARCQANVPVAGWEDHQLEHEAERREEGSMPVVSLPPSALASRPQKSPHYTHITVFPETIVSVFQPGASMTAAWDSQDQPPWQTSLPDDAFFWYSMAVIPDRLNNPLDLLDVVDRSVLTCVRPADGQRGEVVTGRWPLRTLVSDVVSAWPNSTEAQMDAVIDALRHGGPLRDVTISNRPICVERCSWEFRLEIQKSSRKRSGPVGIMFVFFGIQSRAINA